MNGNYCKKHGLNLYKEGFLHPRNRKGEKKYTIAYLVVIIKSLYGALYDILPPVY